MLATAQTRQLAITIDDLPRGGDAHKPTFAQTRAMTLQLTEALKGIPVAVFVNPGAARLVFSESDLDQILRLWKRQGAEIGNHTATHPDLNNVPLAEYQADILLAEPALRRVRNGKPSRYFRHPFLHTGPNEEVKSGLSKFLQEHHFEVAPVTIDTADWAFARVYTSSKTPDQIRQQYLSYMQSVTAYFEKRSLEVTGTEPPQILLIHANQLNADTMPLLLDMFRQRGYQFITLDKALQHPAYQLPDGYTGRNGISWLHRWAAAKGLPPTQEPTEPQSILDELKRLRSQP